MLQVSLRQALDEIKSIAMSQTIREVIREDASNESWESQMRWAAKATQLQQYLSVLKPFALEAMTSRDVQLVTLGKHFSLIFEIFTLDEVTMFIESHRMYREDQVSLAVRKALLEAANKKPKKKKKK
eukprot:gene469-497_t